MTNENTTATDTRADRVERLELAIRAFCGPVEVNGTMTDELVGNVEALQEVYRTIPNAARGPIQSEALTNVGEVAVPHMLDILTAFLNMPTVTRSRAVERLSDEMADHIKSGILTGIQEAFGLGHLNLSDITPGELAGWLTESETFEGLYVDLDDNRAVAFARRILMAMVSAVESAKVTGGAGSKTVYRQTLVEVIESGALPMGTKVETTYNGVTYRGVVRKGGITFDGTTYTEPSPMVRAMTGQKSVNGWADLTVPSMDGVTLGSLRTF